MTASVPGRRPEAPPLEDKMGRPPRHTPEAHNSVLVEVTVRTIGARSLLVPVPNPRLFNEVVVGVIGRALEVSPVGLAGLVVLTSHAEYLALPTPLFSVT